MGLISRFSRRRFTVKEPGSPPGVLKTPDRGHPTSATVTTYGPDYYEKQPADHTTDLSALRGKHPVTWINIVGTMDTTIFQKLGETFHIHPLALEDVLNGHQSPKTEVFEDHLFIVARLPKQNDPYDSEQVSLLVFKDMVISVQEGPPNWLAPVEERVKGGRGKIRKAGADYMAYAILDVLVDMYFPILDNFTSRYDEIEEQMLQNPDLVEIGEFHLLRHELIVLRRSLLPMREMLKDIFDAEFELFKQKTVVYLKDVEDHLWHANERVETSRDLLAGLMDLHLSTQSNKMNEIMKVLTLIATIFIPLTFIAGIYGMNFDPAAGRLNMPELGLSFGYPLVMAIMIAIGLVQLLYFRHIGWIGKKKSARKSRESK